METGTLVHTRGRLTPSPGLQVSDNVTLTYRGPDPSTARIQEPLSPLLNYFELVIVNKGVDCGIGIGAGQMSYPLHRLPGWNRDSVGYHADNGKLYQESGRGHDFGPTCTTGDRMGCGVTFESSPGYVEVFFTKNGKQVGNCMRMKRPVYGLYPLIGLHSNNEKVRYLGHWHRDPESLLEPMIQDHSPSSMWLRSNGVRFLDDGLTLEYCGISSHAQDVGIAQSRYRLDRTNHYFEMELLSTGSKGALAIGLAKNTYPLHVHPGWNQGAIGYHADDGKVFIERGQGDDFGPCCGEGDRMGCGIKYSIDSEGISDQDSSEDSDEEIEQLPAADQKAILEQAMAAYRRGADIGRFRQLVRSRQLQQVRTTTSSSGKQCTVYFTKNGELIGERQVSLPKGGFYPVVAMLSQGERVRVNWNPLSG